MSPLSIRIDAELEVPDGDKSNTRATFDGDGCSDGPPNITGKSIGSAARSPPASNHVWLSPEATEAATERAPGVPCLNSSPDIGLWADIAAGCRIGGTGGGSFR